MELIGKRSFPRHFVFNCSKENSGDFDGKRVNFKGLFVCFADNIKSKKKMKKISKKLLTNRKCCAIIIKSPRDNGKNGSIAQLGEHLPYKQRVIGSSPIVSTIA